MTGFNGSDRRRNNDNSIMFMQELQRIAEIAASTNTNITLLRAEVSDIKSTFVSCDDLAIVEKKISGHIEEHKEVQKSLTDSRRFNIGSLLTIATIAAMFLLDLVKRGIRP